MKKINFETYSPYLLRFAIEHELKNNNDTIIASKIALERLKKDPTYYNQFGFMEPEIMNKAKNNKSFIKKIGNMFYSLNKARMTKYIKRLPKPSGKGYIYFYNQQQIKDYKTKGILPGEKPVKKKGLFAGIMSFFNLESDSAKEKVQSDYQKSDVKEKFGLSIGGWVDHVSEYFNNKLKWDTLFEKKLQAQESVKDSKPENKKEKIVNEHKASKKIEIETKKNKFNTKAMYFIYNFYKKELSHEEKKSGDSGNEFAIRAETISGDYEKVHSGATEGSSLSNVPEREPTNYGEIDVLAGRLSGERPGRNVRLTKGQIKELRKQIKDLLDSKTDEEMTEADKELLRQYEGAGGIKEDDKSIEETLYEYYTPKNVVNKVWDIVNKYIGPGRKNVLEPSAGIGRFAEKLEHDFTMFELDKTSARINKILYPDAKIENKAFQEMFMKGGVVSTTYKGPKYDVVIGNPPYGSYAGYYKGIGEGKEHSKYEEYFIDRGLDAMEPGGIMAYVVPSSFLRGKDSKIKKMLSEKGRLMEAYRLPNGTFSTTGVGTDIIIIRKEPGSPDQFSDNKYFKDNPEHILGEETTRTGQFEPEQYVSLSPGDTFDSVISSINPENIAVPDMDKLQLKEEVKKKIKVKVQKETEREELERLRTEKRKKEKPLEVVEEHFETMPETETVESFNEKYNKKYNKDEINIWKNTDFEGKITIEKLSGKDKEYLEKNPNICMEDNEYYHKTNYASGDIYKKLEKLEDDKESLGEERYNRQKEILESAIPEYKTVSNFSLSPISHFAKEFTFPAKEEEPGSEPEYLTQKFLKWATGRERNFHYNNWEGGVSRHDIPDGVSWSDIIDYMEQKAVRADTKGDKVTNQMIANRTRERRRDTTEKLFKKFLETGLSPDEQNYVEKTYNKRFNSYVAPNYSKVPIFVDGLSTKFKGKDLIVKEKQLQGASFLSNKGNGLLAYDVGVGKTMTGILATVNQLQTGRAKRPVVCVPKAVYENWIKEIRELFPEIKINELGNLGSQYVKPDLKIDEGTLSVMTYEALQKMTFKPETIHGDLINDMLESQQIYKEKMTDRERAEMKEKIYEKLGMAAKTKTAVVDEEDEEIIEGASHYLENLGFDHITVDEVHNFKNVFGGAKPEKSPSGKKAVNEFAGLTGGQSARAMKMFALTQVIQQKNEDRNIFALSATPFTNSPLEIYNILSLVARKRLKELGLYNLHEFMATFAKLRSEWAVKTSGEIERKNVMKEFQNLSALQNLIREYIDKIDGEEAGIIRPEKLTHEVKIEMTPIQKAIYQVEMERFDLKDPQGRPVPGAALKAINNMRMATVSPSLIDFKDELYLQTDIPEMVAKDDFIEDSPKLKFTFDSVADFYGKRKDLGQIIYMPRGVKRYKLAIDNLIKKGIPKNAIATISSKTSNKAKEKIMADFNDPNGKIKVVIGSETIKEGINLNGNSAILYNTLLGWNPSETTQVEGRLWRQGNKQGNVHVVYPQLIDSVDSAMYQKHDEKKERTDALWRYKGDSLNVEDIKPEELKFELIKDPEKRAKLLMDQKQEKIDDQKSEKRSFIDTLKKFENDISEHNGSIENKKDTLETYENDVTKAIGELEEVEKEMKAFKKSADKKDPDYKDELADFEAKVKRAKENVTSEKKYVRDIQREITLSEKTIEGINSKLNSLGVNLNEIDKKIESVQTEIDNLVKEEAQIKRDKDKFIAECKADILKKQEKAPPLSKQIKDHVDLVMGNIKPMVRF